MIWYKSYAIVKTISHKHIRKCKHKCWFAQRRHRWYARSLGEVWQLIYHGCQYGCLNGHLITDWLINTNRPAPGQSNVMHHWFSCCIKCDWSGERLPRVLEQMFHISRQVLRGFFFEPRNQSFGLNSINRKLYRNLFFYLIIENFLPVNSLENFIRFNVWISVGNLFILLILLLGNNCSQRFSINFVFCCLLLSIIV